MIKFTDSDGRLIALAEMQMPADVINCVQGNVPAARLLRVFK